MVETSPSRNIYVYAIVAGFMLALPVCVVLRFGFSMGIGMFAPLLVIPLIALFVAALARSNGAVNNDVAVNTDDAAELPAGENRRRTRQPISKNALRNASVITVFMIPLLMLCFLPLTMVGQLPIDFWENAKMLLLVGFLVSIPMAITLFVASRLP